MLTIATSIALGVCLSAACGVRVFAPLLVLSGAGMAGFYTPAEELSWISSWTALALFGSATVVEVIAYYVPWADNLLDSIATPAAVIAGVIASASVLGELPPPLQWTLAAVAGGGVAGLVQTSTVILRGASTATTGGFANFGLSTAEIVFAIGASVLALFSPLVAFALLSLAAMLAWRYIVARRRSSRSARTTP